MPGSRPERVPKPAGWHWKNNLLNQSCSGAALPACREQGAGYLSLFLYFIEQFSCPNIRQKLYAASFQK
jgi:hypothetical protein